MTATPGTTAARRPVGGAPRALRLPQAECEGAA